MKIDSKDISVVIQGPIINGTSNSRGTKDCIESVLKVLPLSEIIISTWENSKSDDLFYNKLVINKDPGAISYSDKNLRLNNNNRQILSSKQGIKVASRKYCLKIRGDVCIENSNFLSIFEEFQIHSKYKFLNKKIITTNLFTLNPRKIPCLFHVSDIVQFGLTVDLLDMWDIPLQPEPNTTRFLSEYSRKLYDPYPQENYKIRFASEQYIFYSFCKKKGIDFILDFYASTPIRYIIKSEWILYDNFIILPPFNLGFIMPNKMDEFLNYPFLYTENEYYYLYNRYCIKGINIAFKLKTILKVKILMFRIIFFNLRYFKNA